MADRKKTKEEEYYEDLKKTDNFASRLTGRRQLMLDRGLADTRLTRYHMRDGSVVLKNRKGEVVEVEKKAKVEENAKKKKMAKGGYVKSKPKVKQKMAKGGMVKGKCK